MQAAGVDVFLPGTLQREMGLIFRQARDRGYDLQLVSTSAGHYESFPMIAGPGLEGTVMVEILIGEDGEIARIAIRQSIPDLDAAAMDCVRQWSFTPALANKVPTATVAMVPVAFRIY